MRRVKNLFKESLTALKNLRYPYVKVMQVHLLSVSSFER